MSAALTEQVKRKLNITWSDEDTDARVKDLVSSAQVTMRHKLGLPDEFDFGTAGQENVLFLAWCLYEWNHAAHEFDANYLGDILQVRQKNEVTAHEADGV